MSFGGTSSIPLPLPGDRVAGKYRIERLLGRGGMGAVYLAEHEILHSRVALKFLIPELDADAGLATRFLNEGRAVARIRSEHVATVFDADVDASGAAFLVLEYLEGRSLDEELQARGTLPPEEAVHHVLQALEALAHAHALGIVHRDLKPSNLFLVRRPDGAVSMKVLDFGISKIRDDPGHACDGHRTEPNALLGSPLFMAPEHVRDAASVDARADVWSMGVILYRMLTGVLPFDGPTLASSFAAILVEPPKPLREHAPLVPEELEGIVLRCLSKLCAARFQNVGELATALSPFAPGTRALAESIVRVVDGAGEAAVVVDGGTLASSGSGVPSPVPAPVPAPPRHGAHVDPLIAHASTVGSGHEEHGAPRSLISSSAALGILIAAISASAAGWWWLDQEVTPAALTAVQLRGSSE